MINVVLEIEILSVIIVERGFQQIRPSKIILIFMLEKDIVIVNFTEKIFASSGNKQMHVRTTHLGHKRSK